MPDITHDISVEPLNERIKQLERLLELSRNLSATLEPEPLLQTIIEVAADITYSQEASILLYNEVHDKLEFVAAPWFKRDTMKEILVPLDKSIAGQVFTHIEPIFVADAQSDPRHYRIVDKISGFKTQTLLTVPMVFQGKSTGVLTAVNKLGDRHYTENDVRVLETLASQAAIAIENAKLLKRSQEAYDELAEIDRMKSDFIAITSHELRTPLGLILGHATFLQETAPEELSKQIEVIVRSSMRLKGIIEDLSKIDNFQTGQSSVRKEEVNLNQLATDVKASFKEMVEEKNINLSLNMPNTLLTMEGDMDKITIALNHLVKNALTYVDEEGKVVVSLERVSDHIKISVKDDGIGIPEKDLERIFERFYQVEAHMTRRHGGMGLGLSVAKLMVVMHGGRITVESTEGKGSTFSMFFPTVEEQVSKTKPFI